MVIRMTFTKITARKERKIKNHKNSPNQRKSIIADIKSNKSTIWKEKKLFSFLQTEIFKEATHFNNN